MINLSPRTDKRVAVDKLSAEPRHKAALVDLIPKKRISRKTETNGIGKGKDFGKFGIKFWMQSGIIIMQA